MDEIIKDFGEWRVPATWDEVTLKQFQEIEKYYSDKDKDFDVRDVLHIFTNKSQDEINELPMDFVETLMTHLLFLQTQPEEKKPSNSIKLNGTTYTIHTENKLKVGEYVACDTALKADKHNYAALLAILARKDGELYDSKYENEVLEERIKMWEQVPVTKVLPVVSFFLSLYVTSLIPSQLSLQMEELISLTAKDIETLHQSGEISKRSMKSLMKKLKKLEKSISST